MVAKEGESILFASSFPRGELLTGHDTSGGATTYQFTSSSSSIDQPTEGERGEGERVVYRGYKPGLWTRNSPGTWLPATISWGRLFHSGMVRGKNGICLYCVLQ